MHLVTLPDNSARYPDRISAPAPRGLREQVMRAAAVQKVGSAEFIRRAVTRMVADVLPQEVPEIRL